MKTLFIDTNILMDYLIPDRQRHEVVNSFIDFCRKEKIELSLSISSVCTLCYFLERMKVANLTIKQILVEIAYGFDIVQSDRSCMLSSSQSGFLDLEDAILYFTSVINQCDAFITRNVKDFPKPHSIPVFTPEEFLAQIK